MENRRIQTFPSVKRDGQRCLRWLLGFALESSEFRTPTARRRVCQQVDAYLDGLRIRCAAQKDDESRVRERGDSRTSDHLPMTGKGHQKSFEEKLALIRSDVCRVVHEYLRVPTATRRVTGAITWQRILVKDQGRVPTFHERWVVADVREGIRFRLLEDLAKAGSLVRQCPATGCGRVFVRRYRQEFCSTACRNRTNVRIWYQRTRKKSQATLLMPQRVPKRKRYTLWRRARIPGKPTRHLKSV